MKGCLLETARKFIFDHFARRGAIKIDSLEQYGRYFGDFAEFVNVRKLHLLQLVVAVT
jgi:hypothetical protein